MSRYLHDMMQNGKKFQGDASNCPIVLLLVIYLCTIVFASRFLTNWRSSGCTDLRVLGPNLDESNNCFSLFNHVTDCDYRYLRLIREAPRRLWCLSEKTVDRATYCKRDYCMKPVFDCRYC